MTPFDFQQQRLQSQRLASNLLTRPEQVVEWLGAVQAQEYPGAAWGVAQRASGLTQALIDRAFAQGAFLRTHVMRPTWHFVAPADIRWLLALTAPRVHAVHHGCCFWDSGPHCRRIHPHQRRHRLRCNR